MFFLAELQSREPEEYSSMFSSIVSAGDRVLSMREPWPNSNDNGFTDYMRSVIGAMSANSMSVALHWLLMFSDA